MIASGHGRPGTRQGPPTHRIPRGSTIRQHVRLHADQPTPHVLTIPNHSPLKIGTLAVILADVAESRGLTKDALLENLFNP